MRCKDLDEFLWVIEWGLFIWKEKFPSGNICREGYLRKEERTGAKGFKQFNYTVNEFQTYFFWNKLNYLLEYSWLHIVR